METSKSDNLIRGMCFINGVSLIGMFDISATYSFISLDCIDKLNLKVYFMIGGMVIDIPVNGSVTTSLV